MTDDRAALETALAANPDDAAVHAAYADLLAEQGDPRGEYIRLQLALEDRNQPATVLRAMEQEAYELRRRHEAEWLGPLAAHISPAAGLDRRDVNVEVLEANVQVTYRRGWVHELRVRHMTMEVAEAIASCPIRLLAESLMVESGTLYHAAAAALPNLRHLCLFTALFVPVTSTEIWFHAVENRGEIASLLAETVPRLESLTVHSQDFTDHGVSHLIRTGLIARLTNLDLSDCAVTDDGAQLLADCPAVRRLDTLELAGNHLSPIGIDTLAAVGVAVSQRQRLGPPAGGDDDDPDAAGVEW